MRGTLSLAVLSSAVAVFSLTCPSRAARPWPDSTARTVVFTDQLPSALTAAQRAFAATNLAGAQKLLRSEVRNIRAYNTNFLCLHYQLAVGAGTAAFVVGDAWVSDWAYVTSRSNWFMLNGSSQRVHQTAWNWDLADIVYTNGVARSGYPYYWTTSCLARIAINEDDGVFADSFTQDAYSFGQCSPSHPWLEEVTSCLTNWVPALTAFGGAVRTAFEADTNGFLFLPNLGALITGWDTTPYGLGHGGMIEGFSLWGEDSFLDPADWRLQMTRAMALARSNKVVICQSYTGTLNYPNRMLIAASYLLVRGARTYLNILTTGETALEYYPEYTLDVGGPLAAMPANVTNYWHAGWGVFRRDFSNAVVLVNPSATPVAIASLGTNYLRATVSGGGTVNSSGLYGGSVSYAQVTGLTVAAWSGAVLFRTTNAFSGGSGGGGAPSQPTGLAATHRSGQTFLTWTERGDLDVERYRVYRHSAPITASNRAAATLLYTVPEGSARFFSNRYNVEGSGTWAARYLDRYVIAPNGSPLASGTGLLVWTLESMDFGGGSTGAAYYAVTTVDAAGVENTNDFMAANAIGPVAEGVADPLPVRANVDVGARGHLYIQYMNLRRWNPTFHAPHARNDWYGLAPGDPGVSNALQYAYDYVVYEPEGVGSPAPAYLNLHGWGGNTYGPTASDPEAYGWNSYKIYPTDVSETWYFGFARDCDYRTDAVPAAGDTVENYTEQRVLRMLYDLIRAPPGVAVDTNRLYVWGQSMGGSGTLALALRYPEVFAAAYASEPMTDYATSGDGGGTDWRGDVELKWGARALNLPVAIRGPGAWGAPLQRYNGRGVWDWQNHRSNLVARAADEMVPFGVAHGTADTVIEWITQGRPVYASLDASRHAWGGSVSAEAHNWQGFAGLPPPLATDSSLTPFRNFSAVKNESVPGLSAGSADLPIPPSGTGGYNQQIEWSASWYDWDGAPVDTPTAWQVSLRTLNGATQTVSVTPRRLQRFPHGPGAVVDWTNRAVAGGAAVQTGRIAMDASGLATVPGVRVTPGGNRISYALNMTADLDGDGMPDSWEAPRFTNGTAAAASGDADGDGARNVDEYIAGTEPGDASSIFRIEGIDLAAGPGRAVLRWTGRTNRFYAVQYAAALTGAQAYGPIPGATNLPAMPAVNLYTDTTHGAASAGFYRLDVRTGSAP